MKVIKLIHCHNKEELKIVTVPLYSFSVVVMTHSTFFAMILWKGRRPRDDAQEHTAPKSEQYPDHSEFYAVCKYFLFLFKFMGSWEGSHRQQAGYHRPLDDSFTYKSEIHDLPLMKKKNT